MKGQSKTTKTYSCQPIHKPEDYSPVDYPVSKQLSTLLRHGHLPREGDGAVDDPNTEMMKSGRVQWQGGGGNKKIHQCRTDPPGQEILHPRALQGHSGRNLVDPSLQDNVLIPNDFFEYVYHVGCAIHLHSIMNSGLIPGGQILSKRQTVVFTSVDPMNKEHGPRLAWYKQKVWKKHQNTVYWVDIKLALSNTIERNHPLRHASSLLYPEGYPDEIRRSQKRESCCITSTSSKDFF